MGKRAPRRPEIVIIGAGFGGLAVARGLRHARANVTLVDRQNHHLFQPLLYQVATAGLSPADIAAPIRGIVRNYANTRVLLDSVVSVDTAAHHVLLDSGTALPYDGLVIATGARHSYFGREDWAVDAPGIKTIDDAIRVRSKILVAMERAETERQRDPEARTQHLTFIVIGGGPTGVEMAGAIAELTRHAADLDFQLLSPSCIHVMLVQSADRLLAAFPASLAARAKRSLEKLGVEVRLGTRVTDVTADSVMIGDQRIPAAVIVWAAGVKASPAATWLGAAADRAGRVIVRPNLSVPGHPDIFVIGDTASVTGVDGRSVPGVAPAAKQQGQHVARIIAATVRRRKPPRRFRYKDYGNLATIGRKRAVADFGWVRLGGFSAWLVWSTAHIFYLSDFRSRVIVGTQWLWSYITFDRGARLITGLGDGMMATTLGIDDAPHTVG
ncbi:MULTISPECIES: NAD(P)/FAD-dependent oxidoreductase [unclassified Sphingomonas]|uniref:NAD(P)/FAD-dependent oxidoreductase n=1 Tax=unclassified Sphingomonas TaxID=196159 RepID=UPI000BCF7AC6|nr:MAG: FAD-dependent oxidoreductase [Sphingomonas sp. 12-62-6]OYX37625.1 MAG: FAD-dependent oxidoreductase [Sphingomonas sp. 32-62-10]